MSIRAVCKQSLSSVTPELLAEAIMGKLPGLVALYAPREDEPLREVLARLRIERADEGGRADGFGVWRLHYAEGARRFLRLDRLVGREFEQQRRDLFDEVAGRDGVEAERVRALLSAAKECVSIELSASDAGGMGLPLAMAAVASLAKAGDGLIRADGEGWLEPKEKEVGVVLSETA